MATFPLPCFHVFNEFYRRVFRALSSCTEFYRALPSSTENISIFLCLTSSGRNFFRLVFVCFFAESHRFLF